MTATPTDSRSAREGWAVDGRWPEGRARPSARGKFFARGEATFHVRGVTYGTFAPGLDGSNYPDPGSVEGDFAAMAANGINAVRTYTVPPRRVLDAAERHGLVVLVGLAWEQHVAFLDHRGRAEDIKRRVRQGIRDCKGHPAVLGYAIGNEIPAAIVRWHGKRRVERFLRTLHDTAKAEDPGGLVTYVNYPPTEYLELPFLDFVSFNVYLEDQARLDAYLARLHNLAGDRPLVLAEIGLDSRRHGEVGQAEALRWQLSTSFASGCAGAFAFAWTDQWYITYLGEDGVGRGGSEIEDWDFGLTDRKRRPKAALASVREVFADVPFPVREDWPPISVVVCSHNGEATIEETCRGLRGLDYPRYEVIVVDDGSTDATADIARRHGFRVISTQRCGLSSARNTGLEAATGDIVAYLDDDAFPDRHWLTYMARAYGTGDYAGVGGPNLAPPGDGTVASCIAQAPGNPAHVLLSDREAEHIPGCNCSFRRDALEAIGGFDPAFRVAGDDVDVCWRVRERGWRLGFSPAAVVWHHRRRSVRAFWRQQRGYGRAEALLEHKWPDKYNAAGHSTWQGRLYGSGLVRSLVRRQRVYHGTWGGALFQSLYETRPGTLSAVLVSPEWNLVIALLAGVSALGAFWAALLLALPLLVLATGASVVRAVAEAARVSPRALSAGRAARSRDRALIALLFLTQPLARLAGRIPQRLGHWMPSTPRLALPAPRSRSTWSEHWRAAGARLGTLESELREHGARVRRGGAFDRWDLEVGSGSFGWACLRMAIEEHGAGRQLVRCYLRPRASRPAICALLVTLSLTAIAAVDADAAPVAVAVLGATALTILAAVVLTQAAALGQLLSAVDPDAGEEATRREPPQPSFETTEVPAE
jgi:GT2 family glycosyltransferase